MHLTQSGRGRHDSPSRSRLEFVMALGTSGSEDRSGGSWEVPDLIYTNVTCQRAFICF